MKRIGRIGDFARRRAKRNMATEVEGGAVKLRKPFGYKDPLMAGAFSGFIAYAATNPDIVRDFEKKTGIKFPFKQGKDVENIIDRMIDEACGVEPGTLTHKQIHEIFDRWVNYLIANWWGESE